MGGNIFSSVFKGLKKGAKWAKDHKTEIKDVVGKIGKLAGLGRKKTSKRVHHRRAHRMHGGAIENDDTCSESSFTGSESESDDDTPVTIPKQTVKSKTNLKSILKLKY